MSQDLPKLDIEQEYLKAKNINRALKSLRSQRKQNSRQAIIDGPIPSHILNASHKPNDFIESLKTPCQPIETNGMIIYSPGNDIVFKDVP